MLYIKQYRFRAKHSTIHAITEMYADLVEVLDTRRMKRPLFIYQKPSTQ